MNKHTYTHANGKVSTRNSANRIYTHAVEIVGLDGDSGILNWAGSLDLATKSLGSGPAKAWANSGATVRVVEVVLG